MNISVKLNEQRTNLFGLCHSEEISNFSEYFEHYTHRQEKNKIIV